jgi:hypothetical protein
MNTLAIPSHSCKITVNHDHRLSSGKQSWHEIVKSLLQGWPCGTKMKVALLDCGSTIFQVQMPPQRNKALTSRHMNSFLKKLIDFGLAPFCHVTLH